MAREYFPKGMDSTPISETYMQHVFTEYKGMAREYFPKGMDSTPISETYMQHVFTELNLRLQTCWGYKTPYEVCH